MITEEQKQFLDSLPKGDKIRLIYNNGQVFSGLFSGCVEDDDETFITLKEEGKTTGWSFPIRGLQQIQTLK